MPTKTETNHGQYPKGTCGNPSGRPRGSRNKATLLMEALLDGEVEQLTRKAIDLAKKGDTHALRLCLDRIMPPRRDRCVEFEMPPIHSLDDTAAGISSILRAISAGQLTPQEGEILTRILAEQANVMTNQDLARRIEKLEGASPQR